MSRKLLLVSKAIVILMVFMVVCAGCGRAKYQSGNNFAGNGTGTNATQGAGQAGTSEGDEEPQTAEELIAEAVELSEVENVDVNPSGRLTNAITEATQIVVLEDNGDNCKVQITYPDVKNAFLEKVSNLPETLSEETVKSFYADLEKMVSDGSLPMLEVTMELPVEETEDGQKAIQWTVEAQSAMTGGLYDIYYDAVSEEE